MTDFEKERLDYMKFLKKEIVPKNHPLRVWLDKEIIALGGVAPSCTKGENHQT